MTWQIGVSSQGLTLCIHYTCTTYHIPPPALGTCIRYFFKVGSTSGPEKKKYKKKKLYSCNRTQQKWWRENNGLFTFAILGWRHLNFLAFKNYCFYLPGSRHVFSLGILLEDPYKGKHLHHYHCCRKNSLARKAANATRLEQQRC